MVSDRNQEISVSVVYADRSDVLWHCEERIIENADRRCIRPFFNKGASAIMHKDPLKILQKRSILSEHQTY